MTCEIARWVIALGSVAGAIGLTVLGMGMSYVEPDDGLITLGLILMIGGVAATIVAAIVYHVTEEPDTSTK